MSKREKLLKKLIGGQNDASFTFDEVELLLLQAGFVPQGGKGSHHGFRHEDGRKVVIPHHGKTVKPAYIRNVRNLLKP